MPPSPPPLAERVPSPETTYEPYTDDPSPDSDENGILMQQRQIMDGKAYVRCRNLLMVHNI